MTTSSSLFVCFGRDGFLAVALAGSMVVGAGAQSVDAGRVMLAKMAARARGTRSLRGEIVLTRQAGGAAVLRTAGSVVLMKPNYASIKLEGNDPPHMLVSDGRDVFTVTADKTYTDVSVDGRAMQVSEPWWGLPIRFFFTQSLNPFGPDAEPTAKYAVLPDVGGMHVLGVAGTAPIAYRERVYVDASYAVMRTVVEFGDGAKPNATFEAVLSKVKEGGTIKPADFRFVAPAGVTKKEGKLTDTLLAVGEVAPGFALPSKDGVRTTLREQLAGHKATLINFWYVDCPPCRAELPDFETLYAELGGKGLNLVAIDKGDAAEEVRKLAARTGLTFPILMGGALGARSVFADWRVTGVFPATYVLDGVGKVVYRGAGGDLVGIKAALKGLGVE